jgi:prepilin-type processing-associated H-X9-DG protein
LRTIGLAVLQYEQQWGCLPPAHIADADGKPMHSWRALILRELERPDLHRRYKLDEPWDGPNNAKLQFYWYAHQCPSDPSPNSTTNYFAVVGPSTCWPGATGGKLPALPKERAELILLVEMVNSATLWMEPRDLTLAQALAGINPTKGLGISSAHPGGANVLFADGHVEFLDEKTTRTQLKAMLTNPAGATLGVKQTSGQ